MTESLDATAYTVGWIAALPHEQAAAIAALEKEHKRPKNWTKPDTDKNTYFWGSIGLHNIVIACLPKGVYGNTSATVVGTSMLSSFSHVRVGLLVGIGAGVQETEPDIHLGDVVISSPGPKSPGVVQYDYGKAEDGGNFVQTGVLNKPPMALLSALSRLDSDAFLQRNRTGAFVGELSRKFPKFKCPVIQEKRNHGPSLFFGTIASGNEVVKDAERRSEIVKLAGPKTMCIEMEAAGLMDSFPCLVIRGICDFADSHKNDQWQNYAAAAAAAAAKDFLFVLDPQDVEDTKKAAEAIKGMSDWDTALMPIL